MSRRARTIVGVLVGGVLVVGLGVGRLLGGLPDDPPVTCEDPVPWRAAGRVVGEPAAVVGPVVATVHAPELGGGPTFLNLGNPHPDEARFDVVIYEDVRARFDRPPEQVFDGVEVCVQGRVRDRDGVPQIILDGPGLIAPA